jgi:ribosomal protein L40E
MSSEKCARCGVDLLSGAKFCRKCGEPASSPLRPSVTEAETRVFQATPERGARTEYHDPRPTGPSYLAPNEFTSAPSFAPTESDHPRLKRHGILWATAILVFVLLLFGVVVAVKWKGASSSSTPITKIDVPPPPVIAPPVPPLPRQPPGTEPGIRDGLNYPGAEITMEMTRGGEGGVRQLRTIDSIDKVVAWYTEKLKPTNSIRKPGTAILTGENLTVEIKDGGNETTVLLTEGIDQ